MPAASREFPAESRARVLELARTMDLETNQEAGCVHYRHAADVSDDQRLVLSEIWRDAAALSAHFRTPHFRTFRNAARELLVRGTVMQYHASEVAETEAEYWRGLLPKRDSST